MKSTGVVGKSRTRQREDTNKTVLETERKIILLCKVQDTLRDRSSTAQLTIGSQEETDSYIVHILGYNTRGTSAEVTELSRERKPWIINALKNIRGCG